MASLLVEASPNRWKEKHKAQKSVSKLLRQSLRRKEIQCDKYTQSVVDLKKWLKGV